MKNLIETGMLNRFRRALPTLLLSLMFTLPLAAQTEGILLMAHGGDDTWNEAVLSLATQLDQTTPVEVAFGMANKRTIQDAVSRLSERGVAGIVAVPLFISSHSSVIRATEYLLSAREEAPPELERFARHGSRRHGHGGTDPAAHDDTTAPVAQADDMDLAAHDAMSDLTTPVEATVPIRVTTALDRHPLVADILVSRAEALSRNPEEEVAIIVAHGPVSDEDNTAWLDNMGALAELMHPKTRLSRIEYLTVRDDAPKPIRDQATSELRALVERVSGEGKNVLIVPLLLSYGGIEKGVRKRLEGLPYSMSSQGLLPDDRLAQWVMSIVGRR